MHRSEGVVGVMYRTTLKKWPNALKPNVQITTEVYVPLTIFSSEFTAFESIIIYLKEKESLRFSEIAKLTGRDQRTIWTIYNRTRKTKSDDKLNKKTETKPDTKKQTPAKDGLTDNS